MEIIYRVVLNGQVCEGAFSAAEESRQGELTVRRFSADLGAARIELTQRKDAARGGEILEPALASLSDSVCTVRDFMVGYTGLNVSRMHYYTSDWGSEFSPVEEDFANCEEKVLQINSGRSCKQLDPWAGLTLADGAMSVAVGHGGNWRMEVSRAKGSVLAGLHGEIFEKELAPGASFAGVRVAAACGSDAEEACRALRDFIYHHVSRIGQEHWTEAPVVYNPWWPYEDRFINEDVCRRNADAARALGVTQFMLDAGWFGDEQDTGAHMDWFEKRGDWKNVNRQRFPHGMAALCRDINARGLKFGMWCEIEAIGQQAQIRFEHPEYTACRGDEFLGYACMASPEVRAWAKSVLVQLIEEYGARWIKFDFNLDPGLGCDRPGHGHGKGDGLFEHYRGYYRLLDEIHAQYPDVVLENCSSGGLRLDFETLSHTYFTHLSDPDYLMMSNMGLISSYWSCILYFGATGIPFGTFVLTSQCHTVPDAILDAAEIDGASPVRAYRSIVLPLLRPAITTVAILGFLSCWNDLLYSMLLLQKNSVRTLTVEVATTVSKFSNNMPLLYTGLLLNCIPTVLVFIFFQKYIAQGMVAGAVKS